MVPHPSGPTLLLLLIVLVDRYNTILVKLELWESVMVIIIVGLPLTYAYATLRKVWQVVRHFGVLFFAI